MGYESSVVGRRSSVVGRRRNGKYEVRTRQVCCVTDDWRLKVEPVERGAAFPAALKLVKVDGEGRGSGELTG